MWKVVANCTLRWARLVTGWSSGLKDGFADGAKFFGEWTLADWYPDTLRCIKRSCFSPHPSLRVCMREKESKIMMSKLLAGMILFVIRVQTAFFFTLIKMCLTKRMTVSRVHSIVCPVTQGLFVCLTSLQILWGHRAAAQRCVLVLPSLHQPITFIACVDSSSTSRVLPSGKPGSCLGRKLWDGARKWSAFFVKRWLMLGHFSK